MDLNISEEKAKTDTAGCLAQEWVRDGRGLWAMRGCKSDAGHTNRHQFGAWKYGTVAALQTLIADWRECAKNIIAATKRHPDPAATCLLQCANELAATIRTRVAASPQPEECIWTEDDEGVWDTGCGEKWVFTEGYPWDNGAHFCFACGHRIDAKRWREPEIEVDEPVAAPPTGDDRERTGS